MLICLDAAYTDAAAFGAGVAFDAWTSESPRKIVTARLDNPAAYAPGAFYQRELPVLRAVLQRFGEMPEAVLIDGYVWLDAYGLPGLGAHLHETLHERAPVIGIAKTRFRGDGWSAQILRGQSKAPLYITAAGMGLNEAADYVRAMAGANRIPTMLKLTDKTARAAAAGN